MLFRTVNSVLLEAGAGLQAELFQVPQCSPGLIQDAELLMGLLNNPSSALNATITAKETGQSS